ncbi:MAG: carbamoyltransferase N-terminal domain-containing protein [Myxococcota bacterium]|nr:carbamoyltransferase N-terminal domain-containing protein [Myxococcota bacterium]MEC8422315.1 carbamoyltransferase N-terminal domain-containing protein [Myxococcota bacterium]
MPDSPCWILGISALYHDSAAALLRDGEVVAAVQEERFTRIKHDASLPLRAAMWCLEHAGIGVDDLTHVVFYEKPLRKLERMVVSQVLTFPKSLKAFRVGALNHLGDRLWVGSRICKELGITPEKLLFCEHHLSHAASAFYGSGEPEAAVLVADGVGEWATTSIWHGGADGLTPMSEVRFPHSLGLTYSAFTAFLGFRVNNGEYKVMGMAPYGTPRFVEEVRQVVDGVEGGGFAVNLHRVTWHHSATDSYGPGFEALFGRPRHPDEPLDFSTAEGRRWADIAASIQHVTEALLLDLAVTAREQTGCEALCMAGGVALNSVANTHIAAKGPFDRVHVHPAAGDAGGAVGAAWWAWREVVGGNGCTGLRPDLGPRIQERHTQDLLDDLNIAWQRLGDDELIETVANDLAAGRVVGWVQGGAEWGPRALGFRSILADPRGPAQRDRVNATIKFRESFRPFAPAVPAERLADRFTAPAAATSLLPWMLAVVPVRDHAAVELGAVTHVDGSARVQAVHAETNPRFHALLHAFGEKTGTPVLLNTSFNLKGEPIVNTAVDALATFDRSGLDVLVLGNLRIEKPAR